MTWEFENKGHVIVAGAAASEFVWNETVHQMKPHHWLYNNSPSPAVLLRYIFIFVFWHCKTCHLFVHEKNTLDTYSFSFPETMWSSLLNSGERHLFTVHSLRTFRWRIRPGKTYAFEPRGKCFSRCAKIKQEIMGVQKIVNFKQFRKF